MWRVVFDVQGSVWQEFLDLCHAQSSLSQFGNPHYFEHFFVLSSESLRAELAETKAELKRLSLKFEVYCDCCVLLRLLSEK